MRMWERLGSRQARDLKGFPDYRTLLGRPGTALLELTPAQKDLVPLPAVSEGNLARQREPGLRAISGARTGLRSALRLALRLSCSWAEKKGIPDQNGTGRSWNEQTQHLPMKLESRRLYFAGTA